MPGSHPRSVEPECLGIGPGHQQLLLKVSLLCGLTENLYHRGFLFCFVFTLIGVTIIVGDRGWSYDHRKTSDSKVFMTNCEHMSEVSSSNHSNNIVSVFTPRRRVTGFQVRAQHPQPAATSGSPGRLTCPWDLVCVVTGIAHQTPTGCTGFWNKKGFNYKREFQKLSLYLGDVWNELFHEVANKHNRTQQSVSTFTKFTYNHYRLKFDFCISWSLCRHTFSPFYQEKYLLEHALEKWDLQRQKVLPTWHSP